MCENNYTGSNTSLFEKIDCEDIEEVDFDVSIDHYSDYNTNGSDETDDCVSEIVNEKENKNLCYSIPIIHPHGKLRLIWDFVVMAILVYTCVEIPYSLAFAHELTLSSPFGIIALCIDITLLFDVLLNFRTAYFDEYDHLRLIRDPMRIAKQYFTHWFFLDFITSIPFEFIIPEGSAGAFPTLVKILRIFRMFRLLKLLRFFRMLKTFNNLIASFMSRSIVNVLKLVKLLCLMTLSAHFVACIWFYVGTASYKEHGKGHSWLYPDESDPETSFINKPPLVQYFNAFYFSVVTLYTTGYGDITPKSLEEKMCASACILVGTCFFAYFIGAIGSLVAEGDRVKCAQFEKLEECSAFCANKKLPSTVSHAVMSHAKYHWKRNFAFDDMDVMNSLPAYLKRDVGHCLSVRYFSGLEIFSDLTPYIRGLIALRLKCVSCNANFELFHAQQHGKTMFIQRTGISYLLDENGKLHKIERGGVVGFDALLSETRKTTLKCVQWSEFYSLDRDDIQDILRINFPRNWRPLWKKIKKRVNALVNKGVSTLRTEIDNKKILDKFNEKKRSFVSARSVYHIDKAETPKKCQKLKQAKNRVAKKVQKLLDLSDSEVRDEKVSHRFPLPNNYEKIEKKLMINKREERRMDGCTEMVCNGKDSSSDNEASIGDAEYNIIANAKSKKRGVRLNGKKQRGINWKGTNSGKRIIKNYNPNRLTLQNHYSDSNATNTIYSEIDHDRNDDNPIIANNRQETKKLLEIDKT